MKPFGDYLRTCCPVCGSTAADGGHWRIPIGLVEPPATINGAGANLLPVLNATMRADWDRCLACESIYLNPIPAAQYQSESFATAHLAKPDRLQGYAWRWQWIAEWLPPSPATLADVCCVAGELLELARVSHPAARLIGVEWSDAYCARLAEIGVEAIKMDLAIQQPSERLPPCDAILLMEAFEHLRYPGRIVADLARCIVPDGRLLFSAQALAGNLPVRPYESVYVTEAALQAMCERSGLVVEDCRLEAGRWLVASRRTGCTA